MSRWVVLFASVLVACSSGGADQHPVGDEVTDMAMPPNQDAGGERPDLAPAVDLALPPAEGKPLWGRSYNAQAEDVAVGKDGAIYLTGQFFRADFGDGQVTSNGVSDGFLIKFDKVGQRLWARTFGRAYSDVPRRVTVDAAGNAVVVGYSLRSDTTSTHDAFVVYYDAAGGQRFFRAYGGPLDSAVDGAMSAAFASDGSVYVTGGFEDRINFGGGDLVSAGKRDIFLAQLSATGAHLLSKRWGFTESDQAHSVSVFPDGDILLSGHGGYPIDFGDGMTGTNPDVDTFVVRLSPAGAARYSKRFLVSPYSLVVSTTAPDGSFWLAGDTNRALDLGSGPRSSPTGRALFAAHFASTGEPGAIHLTPTESGTYVNAVAVDSTGQIVLGGVAGGEVDFGLGKTSATAGSCFFLKQAASGTVRWVHRFGNTRGTAYDEVKGVAIAPGDQVVAGGYLSMMTRLGSVALSPYGYMVTVTP